MTQKHIQDLSETEINYLMAKIEGKSRPKWRTCEECHGSGHDYEWYTCEVCNGACEFDLQPEEYYEWWEDYCNDGNFIVELLNRDKLFMLDWRFPEWVCQWNNGCTTHGRTVGPTILRSFILSHQLSNTRYVEVPNILL